MGFDIAKEFGTDESKEIEGVWEDMGNGCRLLIAREGNPKYKKAFTRMTKPYRQQIRRETLSDEKAEEITIKIMAETILLNWEGLEEDGNPVEYSKAEAVRMLTKYRDFRNHVSELAGSISLFKQTEDEESEKN